MPTIRALLPLALLALLLTACQVTITPTPTPTPDASISAPAGVTTNPSPQGSTLVPAGSVRWVEVTYPSNAAADLMYFEANNASGIRVELYNAAGTAMQLVSRSASVFADRLRTLDGLSLAADDAMLPASVGIGYNCLGPCVATPYRAGTRLVRLINEGSTERNVQLLAYGFVYDDLGEPNDSASMARPFTVNDRGQGPSGAIEHVNDRDFHRIECGASFPESNLRLTLGTTFTGDIVLVAGGVAYEPGVETAFLPCGSVVEVRTRDGTAGPSGASTYSIVAD